MTIGGLGRGMCAALGYYFLHSVLYTFSIVLIIKEYWLKIKMIASFVRAQFQYFYSPTV